MRVIAKLLTSTLNSYGHLTNDGPRWVNKGSTTSAWCKGQSDRGSTSFFQVDSNVMKNGSKYEPLMTSLRTLRWNELNNDDDPAVTLGEGRKRVRSTLLMLDTVCGTPRCMLTVSRANQAL